MFCLSANVYHYHSNNSYADVRFGNFYFSVSLSLLFVSNCDTVQQRRARSRVLILYRIRHDLVAIHAAVYLPATSTYSHQRYMQIQCTINRSFLTQSVCGTLYPSMCANCHLTELFKARLSSSSSSSSCLRSCFYHTAQALVLSGSSSSCYYCTVQLSWHATVAILWCDIAQY